VSKKKQAKGHRAKGGTKHKDIPRQDIVFGGDNTNKRMHWRSSKM